MAQANHGPFPSEAAALGVIRDRLVARLAPREIWLFGSRAEGRARPDSDFDLLLVYDDVVGEAALDYDRAYAPLLGLGLGCDVVPCLESDFAAERDLPGTLAFAAAHGRLLYRRPD